MVADTRGIPRIEFDECGDVCRTAGPYFSVFRFDATRPETATIKNHEGSSFPDSRTLFKRKASEVQCGRKGGGMGY